VPGGASDDFRPTRMLHCHRACDELLCKGLHLFICGTVTNVDMLAA
jgi:hypothetical protein